MPRFWCPQHPEDVSKVCAPVSPWLSVSPCWGRVWDFWVPFNKGCFQDKFWPFQCLKWPQAEQQAEPGGSEPFLCLEEGQKQKSEL